MPGVSDRLPYEPGCNVVVAVPYIPGSVMPELPQAVRPRVVSSMRQANGAIDLAQAPIIPKILPLVVAIEVHRTAASIVQRHEVWHACRHLSTQDHGGGMVAERSGNFLLDERTGDGQRVID